MIGIKIVGILFTLVGSTLLGLHFSKALKYRLEELKQLKRIMILLRGEIKYSLSPLPEALEDIAGRTSLPFSRFLENIVEELKKYNGSNLQRIWQRQVEEDLKSTHLKKEDLERLKQLGETLGFLDKEMQLNTIDMYLDQLGETIGFMLDNNERSEKLYKNLGVLAGIFIAIVLI